MFRYARSVYSPPITGPAPEFLILTLAGWLNRHQVAMVKYLVAENRVLREQRVELALPIA